MDIKELTDFNKQQLEHISLVQGLVFKFCNTLMNEALRHDFSKFDLEEYETFVSSRSALNSSKDGRDVDYQKFLNGAAIQRHITENPHHPEYWDKRGKEMPPLQVILMFFDWVSRSHQRGTPFNDFWEFNTAKLKNQPHALALVNFLRDSNWQQKDEIEVELHG